MKENRLGEKIRVLRRKLNMSQTELSRQTRIARETINRWENGQHVPTLQHVEVLAKVLKADIQEFTANSLCGAKSDDLDVMPLIMVVAAAQVASMPLSRFVELLEEFKQCHSMSEILGILLTESKTPPEKGEQNA